MMTPYIELPALDADGDAACWWVQIDYMNADSLGNGHRGGLVFERVGDVMRAGPVFEQSDWLYGSTVLGPDDAGASDRSTMNSDSAFALFHDRERRPRRFWRHSTCAR